MPIDSNLNWPTAQYETGHLHSTGLETGRIDASGWEDADATDPALDLPVPVSLRMSARLDDLGRRGHSESMAPVLDASGRVVDWVRWEA